MKPDHPPICDYEGSDYQTTFWEHGKRQYEDQVEAIALKRLLPKRGELLLELGAGAGRNTTRYHQFERVILLDYSLSQLKLARQRLGKNARFVYVASNIYHLPFVPGLFDTATMIRTIHHIVDAPRALHEIRQALQPGAAFILEFANKQNLKAIFRFMLRRQSWNPFTLEPVEFATLNFDFHPKAIRKWLRDSNFNIQKQLTVSHFRVNLLKKLLPLKVLVGLDAIVQYTGNWWQLTPSVFILAQAVGDSPVAKSDGLFRCPNCRQSSLEEHRERLTCPICKNIWLIQDGIYDFRKSV